MKNIYKNLYDDDKNTLDLSRKNPRIKVMLEMIDGLNLNNKNILDIGCYDGAFLSLIKNRNNNFCGIEASDYGVRKCKEKNIDIKQFYFDDKSELPYADNYFDLVSAGEIIEHIYDTDFFLDEINRILKAGGKLLISTPNIASLGRRIFLFLGKDPIIEVSPNEPDSCGHIRYFTFKSLAFLLKKHNYKILKLQSDFLNFSKHGKVRSSFLVKIFPTLGTGVICLVKK
jgi:SAM-dependent methyltransferase